MCVCIYVEGRGTRGRGRRGGESAVRVQVCMSVYVYTTAPSPEHCLYAQMLFRKRNALKKIIIKMYIRVPDLNHHPCLRNKRHVFQAIGEPPVFLAASVLFAIQDAVTSARLDAGLDPYFRLDTPATPCRIRMACGDQFTEKVCPG